MQTKNKNGKHKTTLSLCLVKALSVKGEKVKEGKGKTKENNLAKLGAKYTEAKASSQTG